MKKNIWVIGNKKQDMVMVQQCVNKNGSMRATCILTMDALTKNIEKVASDDSLAPSLILLDYEMIDSDETCIKKLHVPSLLSVPLFLMTDARSRETDEKCYELGATVVLRKPLSDTSLIRIEKAAVQHDMTKAYEATVQRQANQLHMAKEIAKLNEQLKSRNELLHRIFGKYFSDEVVDVILRDPQGADLGGKRCSVTVMMADLRGFTSLSEQLTAEAVVDILNHFLGEMTAIIRNRRGTIIEFIGDEILAVFGAPLACEKSEEEALIAAIEMQNCMEQVNVYCMQKGYPEIEMGIGLHKGEVFLGNIGSENLMRYNVIGQAVNLCSRIESYSVGGQILLSHDTIVGINRPVKYNQELDISVKGVSKPIKIYEAFSIIADRTYEQKRKPKEKLIPCDKEMCLWVRSLLEKRVMHQAVKRHVISHGKDFILFQRDYTSDEPKLYEDIEMAHSKTAAEFAYAKVVELTEEGILARITHLPIGFWEIKNGE